MIDLATGVVTRVSAPPISPLDRPIDLEHLSRMTLGDASLEREVLQLFDLQTGILLARMNDSAAPAVAALAHTLRGSARGIGAWHVAQATEALESAAHASDSEGMALAMRQLAASVREAKTVIADLLRSH